MEVSARGGSVGGFEMPVWAAAVYFEAGTLPVVVEVDAVTFHGTIMIRMGDRSVMTP